MSVLIATSLGDIVVDLHTDQCPLTTKNFLKLCKIKYFNGCLFHTVQKDFTAQTGDPSGKGTGGDSIYKFLYGEQARFFGDEIHQNLKHSKIGTVAMASAGENLNASQFYFTLRDELDYLDGKHTVFGEVAEGLETLTRINESYVDENGRPYKNVRIKHTYILEDPFDDPPQLAELIPDASPEGKPVAEIDDEVRLEDDWVPMDEQLGPGELEEVIRAKDAHSSAVVLESIGDIPDAEVKPPENVLFVCKLNPVTQDEDLNTIFSRFGTVVSADVIRDFKTGDSLCYAFIEYETKEACEEAYFKMDNTLIDDRRIHVDFSQSVSKLWNQYRRKEHQTGKGGGCFKCGAPDHIAKDCSGGPKKEPQKYVLRDGDSQRVGNNKYEMVFDGDTTPDGERRKRESEPEKDSKKPRMDRRSEDDYGRLRKDHDKRTDKSSRDYDRNRGNRADESYRGGARHSGSRRYNDADRVGNHKTHDGHGERRNDKGDHRNSGSERGRTSNHEYRRSHGEGMARRSEKDNRHRDSSEGSKRSEKDIQKHDTEGRRREREYGKRESEGGRRDRDSSR